MRPGAEMRTLTVQLNERSYPILIGNGLLDETGRFLKEAGFRGKVAIVTNPTIAQLYLDTVYESLEKSGFAAKPILLPDGEEHKNLNTLTTLYDQLIEARFERGSCILALGGGVVGDIAGFAAATYLRGVPYIQVPTTLLAQVDSSVGGKTAVDHREGKNLIGAFYQPRVVLIDIDVLRTLPRRELIAGLAEVIKYGIIEDAALFRLLEKDVQKLVDLDQELLAQVIETSCAIKARVVEQDEREDDYRAVLNFGHTIGHALEAATGYSQLLHGEAVATGMAKAAALSKHLGYCDDQTLERICQLIAQTGLPLELPSGLNMRNLIEGMEVDKKSAGGKIKFVICAGIGKTRFHSLAPQEIAKALGV